MGGVDLTFRLFIGGAALTLGPKLDPVLSLGPIFFAYSPSWA